MLPYPANMPTKWWLTPSGVNIPTSDITKDIKSGLLELSPDSLAQDSEMRSLGIIHFRIQRYLFH